MTTLRLLILFVTTVGLASCTSTKQELRETLHKCEQQLTTAIEDSVNHGLNYHKKVYENLLTKVHQQQQIVNDLKDDVKPEQIKSKINVVNSVRIMVDSRLRNVNHHEIAKASAVYLAAMKEFVDRNSSYSARQHLIDVVKIINMENCLAANPNQTVDANNGPQTLKRSLELAYSSLHTSMGHWWRPSFGSFHQLANQTREVIAHYRQQSMIADADRAENLLHDFDNITLSLANEWPINTQEGAQYYFALSKFHYAIHLSLELIQPPKVNQQQLRAEQ